MSEIAMRAVIVANPTSRHVDMRPHGALFETKQCAGPSNDRQMRALSWECVSDARGMELA